jgi:hypothetical protein
VRDRVAPPYPHQKSEGDLIPIAAQCVMGGGRMLPMLLSRFLAAGLTRSVLEDTFRQPLQG